MLLRAIIVCLFVVFAPAAVGAQQKFTTQVMIVPAFRGPDRALASKANDIIRDHVAGACPIPAGVRCCLAS